MRCVEIYDRTFCTRKTTVYHFKSTSCLSSTKKTNGPQKIRSQIISRRFWPNLKKKPAEISADS